MTYLPDGVEPTDEVEVTWVRDDLSTTVNVILGEASIKVECSEDGAEALTWLVASLPEILNQAWDAIEAEGTEETL